MCIRDRLGTAIDGFIADPSADSFEFAKSAWLNSRNSYGQSEAFRFYDGPIDDSDGPEGQLNAWPMDEFYVDYVSDSAKSGGIIAATEIELNKDRLKSLNEAGEGNILNDSAQDAEKSVATGYHTVEFLLWGQDNNCLLYTSPSPRDRTRSRMPSSA